MYVKPFDPLQYVRQQLAGGFFGVKPHRLDLLQSPYLQQ
jgi:hypothetical protein